MVALPLLIRELRAHSRRRSTWALRGVILAAAGLLAIGLIGFGMRAGLLPHEIGMMLFKALTVYGAVCALLAGPLLAADSLSREKREGTLELLLLTPLSSLDIVLAKFVTAWLPGFYAVLAYIPILALGFLLGGVVMAEFVRAAALVVCALFLSVSFSLFVSALSRGALSAMAIATGLLAGQLFISWELVGDLARVKGLIFVGLFPSPAFSMGILMDNAYSKYAVEYWSSLGSQVVLSLILLYLASWFLRGISRGGFSRAVSWRFRLPTRSSEPKARVSFRGTGDRKQWLRRRLLDENPVIWPGIHRRFRQPFFLGSLAAGMAVGSLVMWRLFADSLDEDALAVGFLAGLVLFKIWMAFAASRCSAEAARSGELELVLVTPLPESYVISGWLLGLKRTFVVPVLLWVMLGGGMFLSDPEAWVVIFGLTGLLVGDLYTLAWAGLWMGLRSRTANAALIRTLAFVLWLPWSAVLLSVCFIPLGLDQDMVIGLALGGYFITSILTNVSVCILATHRLNRDLRQYAAGIHRK